MAKPTTRSPDRRDQRPATKPASRPAAKPAPVRREARDDRRVERVGPPSRGYRAEGTPERPERRHGRDGDGFRRIPGESNGERTPGGLVPNISGHGGRVADRGGDGHDYRRGTRNDDYHRYDSHRHRYRHTRHYDYYRYCSPVYYGYPGYYSSPYGHYHYSSLDLYFGFRGYYPYDRYYGYYGAPTYVVIDDREPWQENVGALDLNVKPKDTEVYLNGYPIGSVGDFDGIPQLLFLEEGEYELIFYKPGYATERRIYEVLPGLEINVRFQMQPGESVPPEELSHKSVDPAAFAPGDGEGYEEGYGDVASVGSGIAEPPLDVTIGSSAGAGDALDTRSAPAQVRLRITPEDASVYLDGRFIGTAAQVSGARGIMLVDPGEHLLEIVHPAYPPRELRFEVEAGEELALEVPKPGARRASIGI